MGCFCRLYQIVYCLIYLLCSRTVWLCKNIFIMDNIMYYEAVKSDSKGWKTIAWVIGIVVGVGILAYFWQKGEDRMIAGNNRLTDFATSTIKDLGVLAGNQAVIGRIVENNSVSIGNLRTQAAANTTEVDAIGSVLDKLVNVTANTCPSAASANGTSGIPKFRRTTRYKDCGSELFENEVCGQA